MGLVQESTMSVFVGLYLGNGYGFLIPAEGENTIRF